MCKKNSIASNMAVLKTMKLLVILLIFNFFGGSAEASGYVEKFQHEDSPSFAKNIYDSINTTLKHSGFIEHEHNKAIKTESTLSVSYIDSLSEGDLDGDGLEDMLIGIGSKNLSLRFLSDSITAVKGKNGAVLWKILRGDDWLDAFVAGNLDGDAKDDVILLNLTHDGRNYVVNRISALRGNGSLLWSRDVGKSAWIYYGIDFDGDGMDDFLGLYYNPASNSYDQVFVIKGNTGDVLWSKSGNWDSVYPAGDLNGDGKMDVLFHVKYSSLEAVRGDNGAVLWSKTNGGDQNTYMLRGIPIGDDVNGDGREDVALAVLNFGPTIITSTVSMLKGNDASVIWTKTSTSSDSWIEAAWGGDLSGDSIDDVVLYRIRYDSSLDSYFLDKISAVRGDTGAEMWSRTGTNIDFLPVRDLNGDSTGDLLIYDWAYDVTRKLDYAISVSAVSGNNGANLWSKNRGSYDWMQARSFGDLDGNNKEDVRVAWGSFDRDFYADIISAVKGYDGSMLWTKNRGVDTWLNAYSIHDVDGDSTDDMILFTVSYDAVYYPSSFCILKGSDGADIWCRSLMVVSNLQASRGTTWINWSWINPPDTDFSQVIVYIDSSFAANVSAPLNYYNATGFTLNTTHTISTRTVDTAGNINQNWVNLTAMTFSSEGAKGRYDANNSGRIEKSEAVQAVLDYFDNKITKAEAIEVVLAYFSG